MLPMLCATALAHEEAAAGLVGTLAVVRRLDDVVEKLQTADLERPMVIEDGHLGPGVDDRGEAIQSLP